MGTFTFRYPVHCERRVEKAVLRCSLQFARYLVNSGRVVMGVWTDITNRIYI